MRKARRDALISAAQVAYSYGAYTLNDAMQLSRDERELLIAVALSEEERSWQRFESSLGLVWDIYDLVSMDEKKPETKGPKTTRLPRQIRIPLAVAAAPDFFKALIDEYKGKINTMSEVMRNTGGAPVTEISNLSAADARAILTRIGPALAAMKPPSESE